MMKTIRSLLVLLAIVSSSPFLSGVGVLNPGSGFAAPAGMSQLVIIIATFSFFISLFFKVFDFFTKSSA
ncbi:hypothetical protein [Serratia sp. BIGb0163]|uniref:hypothetical protein n=1 Tax=Serratia sp. BIGb0163 TaxID=2940613 RepID=UPI002166F1E3|nr:hypothetical protein [Serratia sp. BIGb0163]MCS4266260.1 hypothetical protein [Serratia sp. BIGb0163]